MGREHVKSKAQRSGLEEKDKLNQERAGMDETLEMIHLTNRRYLIPRPSKQDKTSTRDKMESLCKLFFIYCS